MLITIFILILTTSCSLLEPFVDRRRNAGVENIENLYVGRSTPSEPAICYNGLLSDAYIDQLTVAYGVQKWEAYLMAEQHKIWVAYEEDIFLGFAAGMQDQELENIWYLDSLHVSADARGKGVGTALIRTIGRYAQEQGYAGMSICIVKGNDDAGNLYKKFGAKHLKDFEDDFCGTVSQSEKLLWENLNILLENIDYKSKI